MIERPRYMGTSTAQGYLDQWHGMVRAMGRSGPGAPLVPMPPDEWQALSDHEAHSLFTHTQYLQARAELNLWSPQSPGMLLSVWKGCEPEAQVDMVRQMMAAVINAAAQAKALPAGWGAW